ncbi:MULTISPECIES: YqzL family protein [unclassified Paenibacillus]|nr:MULTISPECIES: YqzL family protein [unclassified Paenibacillus]MBU5440468.1 YqzL family protein [Paenibacillus sp. MSJ-34]CAH0119610.1 hypothetical protein PAE9249_02115 [Paenibacillus sp. CECT 9249]
MRDFVWNYFARTGDVDAYMLYKEMNGRDDAESLESNMEQVPDETAE